MNIVLIWLWLSKNGSFSELLVIPKTLNLTPPELMRKAGNPEARSFE